MDWIGLDWTGLDGHPSTVGQLALCVAPSLEVSSNSRCRPQVPLSEYEFPSSKLANVQAQLEKLVAKNYYLHKSARDAYRSYLHSYNSHGLKDVYDVGGLDLAAVAASFGFENPPKVTLMLKPTATGSNRKAGGKGKTNAKAGASGHKFSANNPYGQRSGADARQFAH